VLTRRCERGLLICCARSAAPVGSPPLELYLWDIPPVLLYLAISNHVAAAATLSLTLSAGPLGACSRILPSHLAPSVPSHHSHSHHTSALPSPASSIPFPSSQQSLLGVVLRSVTKPPLGGENGVLEGPAQAPPEAKAPQAKILSVLRRENGQNGRINGIQYRYSAQYQYQYQYQYTVYMVQYTAAYWTRTHTLYALLPYSP